MSNTTERLPTQFYLVSEFAEIVRTPVPSVRGWLRNGLVQSIKIGRRRLIPRSEVDRLASIPEAMATGLVQPAGTKGGAK